MQFLKLKEVATIVTGRTPSKADDSFYKGGSIPFIKPPHLGNSAPVVYSSEYITEDGSKFANIIPRNAIMVSCIGILGKVGIAGKPLATNQQINSILFDETKVNYKYGYYYALTLSKRLKEISNAAVVPIVNKSAFSNIEIPVPSLDEQLRIVEVLDEAGTVLQRRRDAIKILNDYLASIFSEMFGDLANNSNDLTLERLDNLAEIRSGVTKGRKLDDKITEDVPYMRVANVQDGFIDLTEVKTIKATSDDIFKYKLEVGDLLLTEGGDPDKLGRGGIWQGEIEDCIHQNHIFRVRFDQKLVTPEYASALISSPYGKRYFLKSAKQTTGIATINSTQLRKFPFLLPDIDLQNQYATIAEEVEVIRKRMKEQELEGVMLFNSLVQKAFAGSFEGVKYRMQ